MIRQGTISRYWSAILMPQLMMSEEVHTQQWSLNLCNYAVYELHSCVLHLGTLPVKQYKIDQ